MEAIWVNWTPNCRMLVWLFANSFGLYRGLSSENFLEVLRRRMSKAGAVVSNPVEVPFFDPAAALNLPTDLEDLLLEALQAQFGLDSQNKTIEKLSGCEYFNGLETRLRDCINIHKQLLLQMSADEDISCKSFFAEVAQCLLEVEGLEPSAKGFVNIVSIDISRKCIHEVLQKCVALDKKCLNGWLVQRSITDGEYDGQGFTTNPHVTMCHYSQLPQKAMREKYEPVLGEQVDVKITGLVWSQSIGALSVEVANCAQNGCKVHKSENAFPHVTVWHDKGVSPAESNKLPELLASGEAQRLLLPHEVILQGHVSFWSLNQH